MPPQAAHLRNGLALQGVHQARVVEGEDDGVVDGAAGGRVEPAPVQELRAEHHIHITHEEEHIAPRPVVGPDLGKDGKLKSS